MSPPPNTPLRVITCIHIPLPPPAFLPIENGCDWHGHWSRTGKDERIPTAQSGYEGRVSSSRLSLIIFCLSEHSTNSLLCLFLFLSDLLPSYLVLVVTPLSSHWSPSPSTHLSCPHEVGIKRKGCSNVPSARDAPRWGHDKRGEWPWRGLVFRWACD